MKLIFLFLFFWKGNGNDEVIEVEGTRCCAEQSGD